MEDENENENEDDDEDINEDDVKMYNQYMNEEQKKNALRHNEDEESEIDLD